MGPFRETATLPDYEFWIDVGGTFTDCLMLAPDGSLRRAKILSSSTMQGQIGPGSHASCVIDPRRREDPARFWEGYTLALRDANGNVAEKTLVRQFDHTTGALELAAPIKTPCHKGQVYQLESDEEAPVLAIRYLLGLRRDEAIPPTRVRLGTTRGTNALLTRTGARTAFVATKGFGDILRIGYQDRPRLFDLEIRKPQSLFAATAEIRERVSADGRQLVPLDEQQARDTLHNLRQNGIQSLAICFMHGYVHPAHEQRVAELAHEVGFEEISLSHEVAPLIKLIARGETTTVDAYLNPVLRRYVASLRESLPGTQLQLLTSSGGMVDAEHFRGKDSVFSGPAGGVVGCGAVARAAGFSKAIGFDMGGTSTDVSRFDGESELRYEAEVAGVRMFAPMLAIETIAAGGGSLCKSDGAKLTVGPESAGAMPGPASYGRGGPLALTDINLFLGRILAEDFPFELDRRIVASHLQSLRQELREQAGIDYSDVQLAEGFSQVAVANMVHAIRGISVAKGCDPREYVLVSFGGAGGQHACAVARELGMRQVLIHPDSGLLSAYGMGIAPATRHRVKGMYSPYTKSSVDRLGPVFQELERDAQSELASEVGTDRKMITRRWLDLRYQGVEACLTIACTGQKTYAEAFSEEHERWYGYVQQDRPLEIVAARVEVSAPSAREPENSHPLPARSAVAEKKVPCYFSGESLETPVYARDRLLPGHEFSGPAIVREDFGTTLVEPGWQASVLSGGELLLRDVSTSERKTVSLEADPALLEIFHHHFAGIAERMGTTLRNTAASVNVKERLDFSCALFTAEGDLIANAPHVPVHLGAMSETVKHVRNAHPDIHPGDVFVTNDPFRGGSHLPDVTVISPVFDDKDAKLLFFVASRAHHAEIGGITPGSMPPFSRNLAEEGVLIRDFRLMERGWENLDGLRWMFLDGPFPSRAVEDNISDILAQVAANRQGIRDLSEMIQHWTEPVVLAYTRHIQAASAKKMGSLLSQLSQESRSFVDYLDDGSPIEVRITHQKERLTIDFSGTGPVLAGNLNANRAIVWAAVIYVLRSLLREDIPLNQGILSPIDLILPECLLNPPAHDNPVRCAAMVGGNVETSQRIVDVLLGAWQASAASQGTMNNFLFGDESFGYYETIGGGAGATANAGGASAVQTHMTNTRQTDPEVMESRYPVLIREFSLRRGSGGQGRHRGGDGIIKQIEFLRRLQVSLLTQRRVYAPYGMQGGTPGALGRNLLLRVEGTAKVLAGLTQISVEPGDRLVIATPGGGGYGSAS